MQNFWRSLTDRKTYVMWARLAALTTIGFPLARFTRVPPQNPLDFDSADLGAVIRRPQRSRTAPLSLYLARPAEHVSVYAGLSPTQIDHTRPLAEAENAQTVSLLGLEPDRRYYFEVHQADHPPLILAERHLPLDKARNTRDLGGYRTADGRQVAWGRLFRSDALDRLTPADQQYLAHIGLKLVCDLRTEDQVTARPDRLPDPAPAYLTFGLGDASLRPEKLQRAVLRGEIDEFDTQFMVRLYQGFLKDGEEKFPLLFDRLLDPANLPTLVHCAAGKDRAGLVSAFTLLALGVPEATVVRDYTLTAHYLAGDILRAKRILGVLRLEYDKLAPVVATPPSLIGSVFDQLRAKHGSLDNYLTEVLQLTPAKRAQLRENFLL